MYHTLFSNTIVKEKCQISLIKFEQVHSCDDFPEKQISSKKGLISSKS